MASRKYNLHDGKVGSALTVRLTPKASRSTIAGIAQDGTVKVHVTAAPEEGQDNEALVELLADVLGVPKPNICIIAGEVGRDKIVSVLGLDAVTLTKLVRAYLE
ncbi:MAG: DUF167 domain-containing protein [Anaerolineae bacterium]|jgi:uncharacterized protein|nr:DUF167 domain-containing protein [Anaerolineae bacterium]MBT7075104.1 DUF167 domain-containing protein [Anaerolineae bacterium]MBT7782559.1 DUF167 domain-containing protein [Anaerolineae bacterium]